ncbi:MAG TPA: HEAT repeat domain-containing protein [Prolixibacteraceae bacterium]|nr:HEAT repeat domain-containing protein [Prolixibacteraceae bacterium]
MTNINSQKDHENILNELQSVDTLKVIATLEELRVSGKVSDIPVLVELLHTSPNPEIKAKIVGLFSNLKESEAIPLMIEAIQNPKYEPELKELVSSCWGNGLDFSKYLSLFIDLLIQTDFLVAFEAYTVIMNMTTTIDQAKIDVELDRLDQAMHTTTEQKKALMLDVVDFLPSIGF